MAGTLWEYRRMRGSDVPGFLEVSRMAIGKLETSTGIDEAADATIHYLTRASVRFLLLFLRTIGRPIVDVYVATDGRRVGGTGMLVWLPHAGYVATIATRPELRGQGIASGILTSLAAQAGRGHRAWLALDVERDNETAKRVYRRAGYRDVAQCDWFVRTGLPPNRNPTARAAAPASKGDLQRVAEKLNAARPADLRAALPASARVLDHNEILVRAPGVDSATWVRESSSGSVVALRAYHVARARLAALFPLATTPAPAVEDVEGVLDAGVEWLRPKAPSRCLAVAGELSATVRTALEGRGLVAVVASTTMVRETPS